MKTLYAACLSRLGLSQAGAAELHKVRLDTVKSWSSGRSPVPQGAWADLRAYEAAIIDRSEAIREAWEDAGEVGEIEADAHGDACALMALADFFLTTDENPPVLVALRRSAPSVLPRSLDGLARIEHDGPEAARPGRA